MNKQGKAYSAIEQKMLSKIKEISTDEDVLKTKCLEVLKLHALHIKHQGEIEQYMSKKYRNYTLKCLLEDVDEVFLDIE